MNPTTDQLPPPPQALPLQPPRSSFSCDRHPDENFTGFCPSCLCERLTTLDQSANAASSSRRNSTSSSTAAAALKSIFRVPSSSSSNTTFEAYKNKTTATASTKASFFPELRRTKSFSASKNEGLGFSAGVFEPQRKSCDVRGRNTLWSLFSIDDENKPRLSSAQQQALGNTGSVLETNKEDEEEDQVQEEEIKLSEEQDVRNVNDFENNIVEEVAEIEEQEDVIVDDLKTMKDHIDLDSQSKKPSLSNFWSAASVLGKKWQKWRRKQKKSTVDSNGVLSSSTFPVQKAITRQFRETQSEIADYGFGRRSCDVDPRFSLDAGRISFDDPRYSFDEPRASWDGYLIGRTFPRLPPMVEDVPVVQVPRSDMQISVEEPANADDLVPGGSIQTREYYSDSSSKRRKSLDRSSSIRKMAAAVVAEMDDTKATAPVSNAKVSPATIDYNYGHGGLRFPSVGSERELARDSNSNSLRDDCSETFELGFRDNGVLGGEKKEAKKPRRWSSKLWGFIHRRGGNKDEEEDGLSRVNGVERSYSESWQGLRREGPKKVLRSNSTVSWRNSSYNTKKSNPETNGFGNGKNRRGGDEFVLERNRSARYSPSHTDSGLLRFYLTPLRGSRRSGNGIGTAKSRPTSNSHSIARSMLRLY